MRTIRVLSEGLKVAQANLDAATIELVKSTRQIDTLCVKETLKEMRHKQSCASAKHLVMTLAVSIIKTKILIRTAKDQIKDIEKKLFKLKKQPVTRFVSNEVIALTKKVDTLRNEIVEATKVLDQQQFDEVAAKLALSKLITPDEENKGNDQGNKSDDSSSESDDSSSESDDNSSESDDSSSSESDDSSSESDDSSSEDEDTVLNSIPTYGLSQFNASSGKTKKVEVVKVLPLALPEEHHIRAKVNVGDKFTHFAYYSSVTRVASKATSANEPKSQCGRTLFGPFTKEQADKALVLAKRLPKTTSGLVRSVGIETVESENGITQESYMIVVTSKVSSWVDNFIVSLLVSSDPVLPGVTADAFYKMDAPIRIRDDAFDESCDRGGSKGKTAKSFKGDICLKRK
jgi:hypothetical protein